MAVWTTKPISLLAIARLPEAALNRAIEASNVLPACNALAESLKSATPNAVTPAKRATMRNFERPAMAPRDRIRAPTPDNGPMASTAEDSRLRKSTASFPVSLPEAPDLNASNSLVTAAVLSLNVCMDRPYSSIVRLPEVISSVRRANASSSRSMDFSGAPPATIFLRRLIKVRAADLVASSCFRRAALVFFAPSDCALASRVT